MQLQASPRYRSLERMVSFIVITDAAQQLLDCYYKQREGTSSPARALPSHWEDRATSHMSASWPKTRTKPMLRSGLGSSNPEAMS